MSHKPAGGPKSRNVTQKPVRTGAGGRGVNKDWPAQVGASRGNKVMGRGEPLRGVRAEPYKPPNFQPVKLGNEVALNVGKGGCGTGRTLYGQAGTQGTHGPVNRGNPRPSGELFPGWPAKK